MNRHCDKCGHDWYQRFPGTPNICPKCKTKKWHKEKVKGSDGKVECLKCGYRWFPRSPERPIVCPKCMDPRWFKPRRKKKEEKQDGNG
jgi:predicted Zn-ribbon and HTH transcriptional regulator